MRLPAPTPGSAAHTRTALSAAIHRAQGSRGMAAAADPPRTGAPGLAAAAGGASGAGVARETWVVGGQPTEVLRLDAAGGEPPAVQLLIVPGNPGAAPYYAPFMQALHRKLEGRAAVATVSNLGMDARQRSERGRVHSLEEQIAHKVALLERFVGAGRPPVVLLGHSIGTYMAIHAVHRLEKHFLGTSRAAAAAVDEVAQREWERPSSGDAGASLQGMQQELLESERRHQAEAAAPAGAEEAVAAGSGGAVPGPGSAAAGSGAGAAAGERGNAAAPGRSNVVKVIGVYPFLQVDPDCHRQRRLQQLTRHHTALARLAGAVGRLPRGLLQGLVRLASPGMNPHAVDTTVEVFTNPACVENGLFMGRTEFEVLAAPADWWLLRQLGPRFAVFVAPNDTWFKVWKWDALHREVPGVESYWVDTQTHAFCVSEQQSDELAQRIVPIVQAALPAGSRL